MSQSRVHELRAQALSKLKLPNSHITEELVDSFQTYLNNTNHKADVVCKLKPNPRKAVVRDFLNRPSRAGGTNRGYFWPARNNQPTESEIVQQLSDFMHLDIGKIPRHLLEATQPSQRSKKSKPTVTSGPAQHDSQQSSQESSQDKELIDAIRAMDKLDKQDPTYVEKASDFVLDTARETRRLSKKSTPTSQTQRQSLKIPAGRSPPVLGLTALDSLNNCIPSPPLNRKETGLHIQGSNNSEQLRTPPLSDKRLGKRPARPTDPFESSDDDFLPDTAPDTNSVSKQLPSPERVAKRARLSTTPEDIGTVKHNNAQSPFPDNAHPRTTQASLTPADIPRSEKSNAAIKIPVPIEKASTGAPVSPRAVDSEPLFPPVPSRAVRDIAVQCQLAEPAAKPSERIVIDIKGMEYTQLYGLPSMFLAGLGQCREAYEMIGTNESRVRAVVLRDVEDDLRKRLRDA